mgnify:CR=1 FL=1
MTKIAVTGGTGFIGKTLLLALAEKGYQVKALENNTPVARHKNITPVKGSLNDAQALQNLVKGCDAIVHGAGLVSTRQNQQFYEVNTEGTRRLAQVASYEGRPRFLLVSSLAAREGELCHYGNSKKQAETILQAFPDLSWDVIRPPAVYGPEDKQFLTLLKMVKAGRVFLPSEKARASLLYVDDLVSAICAWVESGSCRHKIYEIHDGVENGYLWREVVGYAAEALSVQPKLTVPPKFALWGVAYLSLFSGFVTRKTPMLSPEKMRQVSHPDWVVKGAEFNTDFNWKSQTQAQKGFASTVNWYRAQHWL